MVLKNQLLLPINLGKVSKKWTSIYSTMRKIKWKAFKTADNLPGEDVPANSPQAPAKTQELHVRLYKLQLAF